MKKILLFILLFAVQSFAQNPIKDTNGEFYFINKTTLDTVKVVVDSSFNISADVLGIPSGTSDAALASAGQIHINETDDQFSMHMGSTGEVSGEASISVIKHLSVILYPSTDYDQDATNRNFPLFSVGDDFPEGITIDEWQLTYTTGNPTTELDANLYRASDWAFTSETSMDVLDTTDGSSSEDTDANINGGAVVANGQVIYIGFDADPTDENTIVIFEMWFHGEED